MQSLEEKEEEVNYLKEENEKLRKELELTTDDKDQEIERLKHEKNDLIMKYNKLLSVYKECYNKLKWYDGLEGRYNGSQ